ncbi:MAG: sigma-70 family RNA polymerase sigma factor [Deltaproteobacteria bacterium]|nr:sigma-70 family RNA polymerase sigma factor [Deltaproteobacteria bacterium]
MAPQEPQDITGLLIAWRQGDEDALVALMPTVYRRLKRMAIGFLRYERGDHTLQPTDLVHEAYLRLIQLKRVSWQDRAHFFAMSSTLMRRVLVEHARNHGSVKRGKGILKVPLEELGEVHLPPASDLLALDEALRDLADIDEGMARIVEMRYFGGLNRDEIAEVTGISSASVTRSWRKARAWLQRYLVDLEQGEPGHGS